MISQIQARIFPGENRGLLQSPQHRSYSTLCTTGNDDRVLSACYPLEVCNDEELAGGALIRVSCTAVTRMLLLPVTGDLDFTVASANTCRVAVGELQLLSIPAHHSVLLGNPFESETINYLRLCFCNSSAMLPPELISFDLDAEPDQLVVLYQSADFVLLIGRFSGRSKGEYQPVYETSKLLSFVIAGAFEVEDRLLHPRDALSLEGCKKMEFEALSNNSLLLVTEIFATG